VAEEHWATFLLNLPKQQQYFCLPPLSEQKDAKVCYSFQLNFLLKKVGTGKTRETNYGTHYSNNNTHLSLTANSRSSCGSNIIYVKDLVPFTIQFKAKVTKLLFILIIIATELRSLWQK
jgi:hypothetical protein